MWWQLDAALLTTASAPPAYLDKRDGQPIRKRDASHQLNDHLLALHIRPLNEHVCAYGRVLRLDIYLVA